MTAAEVTERMPPESEGVPLSPAEVSVLRAWIDHGAKAPAEPTPEDPRRHWAFRPPTRPTISAHPSEPWARNPIDALLADAHRARGLKPAAPIARDLWLRRVTIDLIGLPPTLDELRAFRADRAPDAEQRVVDRLLASPRYGERWGRHWMDVWRYSDWYGLGQEVRFSHPHLWHWRDWIIESLNADKGYDRMVLEMLAGDELAPDEPDTVRATGFLARNWDIFNRNVWLADTVEHTSRAFLGLTMQCARCHDHKFDPIAQVDYYRLRAVFEPYHVRVDRIPGEPDRVKAGLPRAFDDFLDRPTYVFVRGEETRPDTTHPLRPGTPAVLGGELRIATVPLPLTASFPDKRPFVIDEARAEAERNVAAARRAAEASRGASSPRIARSPGTSWRPPKPDAWPCWRSWPSSGSKTNRVGRPARRRGPPQPSPQRRRSARRPWPTPNSRISAPAARSAAPERDLKAVPVAVPGRDDAFKDARTKCAATLAEATKHLEATAKEQARVEALIKAPLTTGYTPRALQFPRAKTTYRDVPPNSPYSKVSTGRRLALARWIVDRRNPLAARVAVNHVWARHFGEPLVGSMSDFGLRTPRPPLADVLDWLAVELIDSGWSLKHLHRLIVTSQAYRMRSSDSGTDDPNARRDPDNRYAWRMNSRRMEGEVIRDSVLYLSGRLDTTIGGPDQPVEFAESGTRRSLYYRTTRDERIPLLSAFDAPNVEECYRRHETVVPQQSLALMNSGMVLAGAVRIAAVIDRAVGEGPATRPAFVLAAYERILGRSPLHAEQAECEAGLARLAAAFEAEPSHDVPGRDRRVPSRAGARARAP